MLKRIGILFLLIAIVVATSAFQGISPIPGTENPAASISYPPPVYTLRGTVEIRGSAVLQGMTSYYLEVTPLFVSADPNVVVEEIWLPVSMANNTPVFDSVLGTWDTTIYDDGLYSLRLTVTTSVGNVISLVSPLRIENVPPPFVTVQAPVGIATEAPVVIVQPTVQTAPTGTALVNGNVRMGDTTAYSVVTSLQPGQTVEVIGISSTGSGWWAIRLSDGREGFAAPSVLNVVGDTSGLPRIAPPPPPVMPTAAPTVTPVPGSSGGGGTLPDGAIVNVTFDRPVVQGQPFQIIVVIRNNSSVNMPNSSVACNFTPQNQIFATESGVLPPNAQTAVAITARLDSGGGSGAIANCAIDVNNIVTESNETNNYFNQGVAVS